MSTAELAKQYDAKANQQWCLSFWEEKGYFHSDPKRGKAAGKKPYTIVIPPPNVTGALHMGHALDNTLQDVLIRWRRMQGYEALWMPGTDHAGIATQAIVEKRLLETEKKTRHDVGREALVQRIWSWKDQYEKRILNQLKQLGCSCDWDRTRFTLDEMCSAAVRQTFFNFFRAGLIFRGKRLINWDTHLQTAVADDEIYYEKIKGHFWTFKYPVKDALGQHIIFSTTRPETMLADVAIAVHPSDERYKHLIGKLVTIPLVGREIPIIADGLLVDPTLGTGAVKVTPAHDPNDYQCGLRNKLPMDLCMMNPEGTISTLGGKYAGLTMAEGRKAVVADMEALGFLEKIEDREIELAHSDRSKTPIEPYLSDQWFVKMSDDENGKPGLAQQAMDAVTSGNVTFHPQRYAKTYLDWLGEKRDWCISRQLWWGHRIPVWRRVVSSTANDDEWNAAFRWSDVDELIDNSNEEFAVKIIDSATGKPVVANFDDLNEVDKLRGKDLEILICKRRGDWNAEFEKHLDQLGFVQDPDVLDTWFSSGLWPHSTLGWPGKTEEMAFYYPTSVLVTSRDIITLWVARMVLMSLSNLAEVPFTNVYIHPKVLDGFGETMSKTKGNGVDPLDIIDMYGADALRFYITTIATETQDARLQVANICPNCAASVPVKNEHMYMRTRKVSCPACKTVFRPGGPWPTDDPELATARQGSDKFEIGRNFTTKLWNAARFALMNLEGYSPKPLKLADLPVEDRWLLSRLATITKSVTENLEQYQLATAIRSLYDFVWSEFCDWYLEMAKSRLKDAAAKPIAQQVLAYAFDCILKLLHPTMPFVTEAIWQGFLPVAKVRGISTLHESGESVMVAPWPSFDAAQQNPAMEKQISRMQDLVKLIRNARNEYRVDEKQAITVSVRCEESMASELKPLLPFVQSLAKTNDLQLGKEVTRPAQAASAIHPEFTAYIHLAGLIDVPSEIKRLEKQLAEKEKHLTGVRSKLANQGFLAKAPAEVVEELKQSEVATVQQLATLKETIEAWK